MRKFTNALLRWFESEKRNLPWKVTNDPYKIWISEIILQQTRVDQGTSYYLRFIDRFPTIKDLAKAEEDEVLKLWEGLGYYSRARNLHFSAKQIMEKHGGKFPKTYEEILNLKGVGPYTAAAIMSYAYGKKYAVVDGNVLRIISRYLGIQEPVDVTNTQKKIMSWLDIHISEVAPGDFNQALMDLGSAICTPKLYKCEICPINAECKSYKEGLQALIPVKSKSIVKKERYFHYLFFTTTNGDFLIKKRTDGIWKGLYELPLVEKINGKALKFNELNEWLSQFYDKFYLTRLAKPLVMEKHVLTHQNIYTFFYTIEIEGNTFDLLKEYFIFVSRENMSNFAFPKIVNLFFEKNKIFPK